MKQLLIKLNACDEAMEWVGDKTWEEIYSTCHRGDWLLWLFKRTNPNDLRLLTLAKGHCANTVRHLMKDERSIKAVDTAIAYGEGKIDIEELNNTITDADATAAAYYTAAAAAYYTAAYAADATDAAYIADAATYAAYIADAATYAADAAAYASYDTYAADAATAKKITSSKQPTYADNICLLRFGILTFKRAWQSNFRIFIKIKGYESNRNQKQNVRTQSVPTKH